MCVRRCRSIQWQRGIVTRICLICCIYRYMIVNILSAIWHRFSKLQTDRNCSLPVQCAMAIVHSITMWNISKSFPIEWRASRELERCKRSRWLRYMHSRAQHVDVKSTLSTIDRWMFSYFEQVLPFIYW